MHAVFIIFELQNKFLLAYLQVVPNKIEMLGANMFICNFFNTMYAT